MCRKSAGMKRGITRRRRNAWLLASNQYWRRKELEQVIAKSYCIFKKGRQQ
jgi:hypothetical protein